MSLERIKIETFLKKYKMFFEDIDLKNAVNTFLDEMEKGLSPEGSSIAMIPTYIETGIPIPREEKVVVLDAGGTNLRTALVSFDKDFKPVIEKFSKVPMPGSKGSLTKDEFFKILADKIKELVPLGSKIGFCFSYPTEILPNRDGQLIKFSKEVICPEVHGELIGANLLDYLKKEGITEEREVVILNDTVATLLTGMISFPEKVFSDYIGYIFGTGINSCYVEANSNITKVDHLDLKHKQIINTECGSFAFPPQGCIDKNIDERTSDPGSYLLEKMVSGGYFGRVVSETLYQAFDDNLFEEETRKAVKALGLLPTIYVSQYLHNPHDLNNPLVKALEHSSKQDKEMIFILIDSLLERASILAATSLAATLIKTEKGRSPLEPVCLTVDGTTFYSFYRFQQRVEAYLDTILQGEWQRYYEIVKVEDAPLLGAAIAALTN